jgi:3-dehydroquinate synthase
MKRDPDLVARHGSGQTPIFVDAGWQQEMASIIAGQACRFVLITDANVGPLYAESFKQSLESHSVAVEYLVVPAGESSKSMLVAVQLYEALLKSGADRAITVIAFGGGVVGDLAGFVAATWMRGVDLIQVPTTLLAQVDSSVGGKTGVNLPQAKNSVGAFWQPVAVFVDTALLLTLPGEEYTSGLAEVVKYAVILDAGLFEWLETNAEAIGRRDPALLAQIVLKCCNLKAGVVHADERETTGHRAILNYGHTLGHALESAEGYGRLRHGHAVAAGMTFAARLARSLGRVDDTFVARQDRLLDVLGIPRALPDRGREELLALMTHDKKSLNGRPRFVLPTRIGHADMVEGIGDDIVGRAIDDARESNT